jgi:ribonuclease D
VISTTAELRELAARVRESEWVALDTEADSLHAYPEKLCLIQVGVPGAEFLVDPLDDLHLEPLWEAMDHHCIIFHAADYDLRLLFRGHHFQPARIFDTMLAARIVGEPRFGLNDVLNAHLGITLEKGSQKANWGRRPLTAAMVDYALNDVRHLHPLRESLQRRLEDLGRVEWHRQSCERLIRDCCQPEQVDEDAIWRTKGHDKLDPLGLAVLRELWHWREKDALRTGRPPFFILKHEQLAELAAAAAETRTHRGLNLPHFLTSKRRAGLLEAVQRGLEVPEERLPRPILVHSRRMTRAELDVSDRLARVRDLNARDLGIDPTLIASKATLFALGRHDPEAWSDLMPWQRNLLETPPAKRAYGVVDAPTPREDRPGADPAPGTNRDDEDRATPVYGLD